ncbi:MAG TPA: hypothetical protein VF883_15555 [Thermoanaerobaculia bacterium]
MKHRFDPALALLVVLLAAHFAVTLTHYHHPLITDEIYWVRNARHLVEHGSLPPIDPAALAAEKGEAWAASDWRPQAYTVFLALCSLGDFDDPDVTLRLRATVVHFLLLAAIVMALYRLAVRAGASRWMAAVLLGIAPWPFEFVNEIGADSLNAFVTSVALLLLWRWIADPPRGTVWLFWSAVVASFPLLVRPEMLVLAPVMIGLAMLLRRPFTRAELFAAVAAFALVLGVQVAYRTWLTGKPGIYGGMQQIVNSGAFHWAETWPGTEKEGYDFVYLLTEGRPIALPDRAFADDRERQRVQGIVDRVRARGRYTREDDATFEALSEERRQRFPVLVASLRLWHTAHLWLNNENPNPILDALAPVPQSARRPLYGALLLLRLAIYAAAAFAAVRAAVRLRRGEADIFDRLTLLMAGFILARSLLVGLVLNWKVHRYVLVAWPAMLWCACAALRGGSAASSPAVSRGPSE